MTDEQRRINPLAQYGETRSKAGGLRRAMQLDPQSEYEAAEFAAASKLGHRRLGRWMNDRLLRRLAGVCVLNVLPFESRERFLERLGPYQLLKMAE